MMVLSIWGLSWVRVTDTCIRSYNIGIGTNNNGNIYFADGTTGSAQYMGMIR